MSPPFRDESGHPVALAARLGRGGEGNVYALAGVAGTVAKVYHQLPGAGLERKLRAMVGSSAAPLAGVAAWPTGLLLERSGAVCGLLMPRVIGRPIHILYGPKSRLAAFPDAGWDLLVTAAGSLARAVAVVHAAGQVVGDLNHANALVDADGVVRLIDCDSFQILDGSELYPCEVGVGTHLAPELQGETRTTQRTANHDDFALAVLLFQLLFVGRHPFSGRHAETGDLPLEDAIRDYRFAYGAAAAARRMRPPPHVPAIETASPEIVELFERAFSPAGSLPHGRPTAAAWERALAALPSRLRSCAHVPAHRFWQGLASCPWCAVERIAGAWLFPSPAGASSAPFDLRRVWTQIADVPHPGALPVLLLPRHVAPSAEARRSQFQRTVARAVFVGILTGVSVGGVAALEGSCSFAILLALVMLGGGMGLLADLIWARRLASDARSKLAEIDSRLLPLEELWRNVASPRAFELRSTALARAREQYTGLAAGYSPRRQALERELAAGARDLRRLARRVKVARGRLPRPLLTLRAERAQAMADLHLAGAN